MTLGKSLPLRVSVSWGTELSLPWEKQLSQIRLLAWPFPCPSHVQLLLPWLLWEMTSALMEAEAAHGRADREDQHGQRHRAGTMWGKAEFPNASH